MNNDYRISRPRKREPRLLKAKMLDRVRRIFGNPPSNRMIKQIEKANKIYGEPYIPRRD